MKILIFEHDEPTVPGSWRERWKAAFFSSFYRPVTEVVETSEFRVFRLPLLVCHLVKTAATRAPSTINARLPGVWLFMHVGFTSG